jgi:hypothetical protein
MTNYDEIDFSPLDALADGEVITHSLVTDVRLASGKTLALITPGQRSRSHPTQHAGTGNAEGARGDARPSSLSGRRG